ncbi:MAG: hypothetical protein U9Q82_14490, partial [Chloroflexota bacterium]|nr:hypothetical protein [Chloroflexota bacterium]
LATTVGWLIGGAFLPVEIGAGLAVGLLQGLILRPMIARTGWWVVASSVGWIVGWGLIIAIPLQLESINGAILGATMGVAQWFVLRKKIPQAGWWIIISTLAWTLGLAQIMGEALVGTVVGIVSGIALELQLRYAK